MGMGWRAMYFVPQGKGVMFVFFLH